MHMLINSSQHQRQRGYVIVACRRCSCAGSGYPRLVLIAEHPLRCMDWKLLSLSLAPKLVLLGLLRRVDWKLHKMLLFVQHVVTIQLPGLEYRTLTAKLSAKQRFSRQTSMRSPSSSCCCSWWAPAGSHST